MTIERSSSDIPTAIISPDGVRTALTVNSNNQLETITYANGSAYAFEYTTGGLMLAKTEPNGNRFEHQFDSNGRLTESSDQEGGLWQYSSTRNTNGEILTQRLTAEGNLTAYRDVTDSTGAYTSVIKGPSGDETNYASSADGLTAAKATACGMELSMSYDTDDEYDFKYLSKISQTTPSGLYKIVESDKMYEDQDQDGSTDLITRTHTINDKTTTRVTDLLLSENRTTSPEGRGVASSFDPDTLLTEDTRVPGLETVTYTHYSNGRLNTVTMGNRQSSYTYDDNGFLASVTDPENRTINYTNDDIGNVLRIDRPDGSVAAFEYDENGNLTILLPPGTSTHQFGYTRVNQKNAYVTPMSGSYAYIYDKDRRLTQKNFPSGKSIILDYENPEDSDDKSLLRQIRTPETTIDYTYLCGSKVESLSNEAETITYGYDGPLLISETFQGSLNQIVSYQYNDDFQVGSASYAGKSYAYTYDNDGLMTGVDNFSISRNAENGLPESVSDNSLTLSQNFNGFGEMSSQEMKINGNGIHTWQVERDDNGRITRKTETLSGDTTILDYTYDSMGRLLTMERNGTLSESYQYGETGARISEFNSLRNITQRSFEYSQEDHLLKAGTAEYQYDADGFLTSKTDQGEQTLYTYSSRGELLNATLPDGTLIEYLHDPLGRRIAKKINGQITEKYLWQGQTRLLAVYDGNDNLLMRFEYADGRMPVTMTSAGVTYYQTYDQVGSLRIVADSSGNVVKQIDYDSFGSVIHDTTPTFMVPFGFAGGLYDRDTGLVRFGYRDYDPDTGRWTAKDPIFFAGGDTDLYGYVLNDPVNLVDPWGLYLPPAQQIKVSMASAVGSAVGGIIGAAFGAPNVGAAIGGALSGAIATSMMPCATNKDIGNNALTGALSGLTGSFFGNLAKGAMHSSKAAVMTGGFSGATDAIMMQSDPIIK